MFFGRKKKVGLSIPYTLKRNANSKAVRIRVRQDGSVTVTAPRRVSKKLIDSFVAQRHQWITEHQERFAAMPQPHIKTGAGDYTKHKEEARALVTRLLADVNKTYDFTWSRVSIRDQRTRWGSCSSRRGLSFNYRLVFLPEKLARYVVVHELCHLAEMNHGPRFWKLVEQGMPDYKKAAKELRDFHM